MPEAEVRTIRRAQAGDPDAFREILEIYQRPVLATLYRFLGGRFAQEIEDYTQDVFVKVLRAIGSFDFDRHTKFSTWLFTFVKNYSVDILKKKRLEAVPLHASRDGERRPFELAGRIPPPPHELAREELSRRVAEAVESLPPDQREVLVLREYQEMSHGEIADILGCSEGTVKSRLYRARDSLRTKLAPYLRDGSWRRRVEP